MAHISRFLVLSSLSTHTHVMSQVHTTSIMINNWINYSLLMGHLMDLIHLGGHSPSPPRLVIIGGKQLTCVDTVQWGMACPAGVVVSFDNIVIHLWIMFSSTSLIMSSPNERVDVSDTNNEHQCGKGFAVEWIHGLIESPERQRI